jgi:hypothetical protein
MSVNHPWGKAVRLVFWLAAVVAIALHGALLIQMVPQWQDSDRVHWSLLVAILAVALGIAFTLMTAVLPQSAVRTACFPGAIGFLWTYALFLLHWSDVLDSPEVLRQAGLVGLVASLILLPIAWLMEGARNAQT